jgi:hypothetical protein
MKKLNAFFVLALGMASQAQAQQPLQANLDPSQYTPFASYYDYGSQQTFYYDNNQNTFFVYAAVAQQQVAATDQEACQSKANNLAATGSFSHGGYTIGAFEGIGMGGSPDCATCLPSYGMTLTGDAAAQRADGMWIRVRSWR